MIISPKVRGFICTTAHPEGCFKHVQQQVDYIKSQGAKKGPVNVLIVGASTGYGLASRITAAFGYQAKTIGVSFEKPASGKRTASAGWYNTAAFEELAHADNLYAKSINGDAFSHDIKQLTLDLIREDWGQVDLLVYSLASPRRTDPDTGENFSSVLKPIGESYINKTIDPFSGVVSEVSLEPASDDEIAATVKVMGGEDWQLWVDQLAEANLLAKGFKTVAYSYIGPELTHPIYTNGAIGRAKQDLQQTADRLNETLAAHIDGQAFCSVNKAVVTQSSAAIPVVPLYIAILFKAMREQGVHEDCIEQMQRLFDESLYTSDAAALDGQRCIRLDDKEMADSIQAAVAQAWQSVDTSNVNDLSDLTAYRNGFLQLFGFGLEGVDYEADVDCFVPIPSIEAMEAV
ncbi:MAG: enoyl-[acyl-carrier-protein] reductase FabV [Coxiellaceae bacterium]|nr:enoyl-[acyl-carrier-protein] reductase FabV [Coxiellaceae bacterium]|tara:strand:- start:2075 stop:3283 length:1209 start_codon:yes stop_codon:yes gene_type:complete